MTGPALPDEQQVARLLALGQAALAIDAAQIRWHSQGGMPWPDYPRALEDFFAAAAAPAWSDASYCPASCAERVHADGGIEQADLASLRRLLTWMVRGERFCDGHWAAMLSQGHLRRWLQRLAQLA